MSPSTKKIPVYLEIGKKRTFAGAIDWPGWNRSGKDEESALQALCDFGPRYGRAVSSARLGFRAPTDASAFTVVERLKGNASTDFGAPDMPPKADGKTLDDAELRRCQSVLKACWRTFDAAAEAAAGKQLRTGPRGGGRQVAGLVEHVLGAEASYLTALGWKFKQDEKADWHDKFIQIRQEVLTALPVSARGEIPRRGPRGGLRWSARYYVRRAAWHVLDHVWELEDRVEA
jgi:hypothetical protein